MITVFTQFIRYTPCTERPEPKRLRKIFGLYANLRPAIIFPSLTGASSLKEEVISGGFNVYPVDIESVLLQHPGVKECAVVGVSSRLWGETPVAYVVLRTDAPPIDAEALKAWTNAQVGKIQRLANVVVVESMPRSEIGKILKRELRDRHPALP